MDSPYSDATTLVQPESTRPTRPRTVSWALASQVVATSSGIVGLFASGAYKNVDLEMGVILGVAISILVGLALIAWRGSSWARFALLMFLLADTPRRLYLIQLFFERYTVISLLNLSQWLFGILAIVLFFAAPSRQWFKALGVWRATRV